MTMPSQVVDIMTSSKYFEIVLVLLSSLVTFMPISAMSLELWQFYFIGDWAEIQKFEIPMSKFYPISGDWGELGTPNFAWMSLMKCCWMQENARVTAFTVWFIKEKPSASKIAPTLPDPD